MSCMHGMLPVRIETHLNSVKRSGECRVDDGRFIREVPLRHFVLTGSKTTAPGHGLREFIHTSNVAIQVDQSVGRAIVQMRRAALVTLIVLDGDSLRGMVTHRELLKTHSNRLLLDCPLQPIPTVLLPNLTPIAAWNRLKETQAQAAPVVEDSGSLLGLILEDDLLRYLLSPWERVQTPRDKRRPMVAMAGNRTEETQLLSGVLHETGCECLFLESQESLEAFWTGGTADLLILCSKLGERGVPAILRELDSTKARPFRVFLVLESKELDFYDDLLAASALDFLLKPLDPTDVRRKIRGTLRSIRFDRRVPRLRADFHLLVRAVENSPTGITISDPDGVVLYSNPAEARMHRYDRDELIGKDVGVFAPPGTRKQLAAEELRTMSTASRETWNHRKDGTLLPVRLRYAPVTDEWGNLLGKVSICEDITEEREIRAELDQAHARNQMILETTTEGILLVNGEKKIVTANRAFLELVAKPKDEVVGRSCQEVIGSEVCLGCPETGFPCRRPRTNREFVIHRSDGTRLLCLFNTGLYMDPDDKRARIVHSFRDITELRRLESMAATSNLMNNLGFIFSGIRHEIGNPLNTILTTARLILDNVENLEADKIRKYAGWILSESKRVDYLLKSLKNFTLFDTIQMRPMDLVDFLGNFVALIRRDCQKENIAVVWSRHPPKAWVLADHQALHHALLNLVSNSVHALKGRPNPKIEFSLRQGKEKFLEIILEDNGRGIARKRQAQLITPFVSDKRGGTGLGLVIVRKILSKMGWEIKIVSQDGEGTRVVMTLEEAAPLEKMEKNETCPDTEC